MDSSIFQSPLFFEKNRVRRVYTGGALFADFFGDSSTDGFEPEEWIASYVKALNDTDGGEKEGVSKLEGADLYFDDLLRDHPRELLGDREELGILVKILDSAVRLPIQAHPDPAFSREHFHNRHGKAESWVVLAVRPGACLYFGFQAALSKAEFSRAVEQSRTDKNAMVPLLNRIDVNPGDVFFVPARMVHAIGEGCLILEVQEPTDFTIQPEYWCDHYALNEREMYLGLHKDTALDVFDYETAGRQAIARGRKTPRILRDSGGIKQEVLIGFDDTPCFSVERYTVTRAALSLPHAPAVYVVSDGEGELCCAETRRTVKKGDYFFLPFAARATEITADGSVQLIACLPPATDTKA